MRVRIPTPLRSYTRGEPNVEAEGATVGELMADLDRRFPGLSFRVIDEQGLVRQHMVIWVDGERCRDLGRPLDGIDEVVLMQALSGG